jgi:dsDNA-specific endonuclease/ATPase MutS2
MPDRAIHLFYDHKIDLHGYHLEAAWEAVEDLIFAYGNCSILVVHGHGDGILRREVRKRAEKRDDVKQVVYGENENVPGGAGVTVIYT